MNVPLNPDELNLLKLAKIGKRKRLLLGVKPEYVLIALLVLLGWINAALKFIAW